MLAAKCYFSIMLLIYFTQRMEAVYLWNYKSSIDNYNRTRLENPLPLLDWINVSQPTVFYAFGFEDKPTSSLLENFISVFVERNDSNFVLVDWADKNRNEALNPVLAHALTAAPNSESVGIELGVSLLQLVCGGLDLRTVHLIGVSLGAHVVGYAGQFIRRRGLVVPRLTALEPSGTKYEGYFHAKGVNTSSAGVVVVLHTDPTNYGTSKSLGTVDIWFNCGEVVQPGCPYGVYVFTTKNSYCSHGRVASYYKEALLSPRSFVAVAADSCDDWKAGHVYTDDIIYVGEIPKSKRKNFYLSTESQPPYGRGLAGIYYAPDD